MNRILRSFLAGILLPLHAYAQPALRGPAVAPAPKKDASLTFVKNSRQWPDAVQYKADVPGGAVFFTTGGFVYNIYSIDDINRIHDLRHDGQAYVGGEAVHAHAYKVSFTGADWSAPEGEKKQPYYHNYFLGKDAAHWAGNVPVYGGLAYRHLYKGIDMQVYSRGTSMKYDLLVAANADPRVIQLKFEGVTPQLSKEGDLLIKTSINTITEQAPIAYQMVQGLRKEVGCRYALSAEGAVSFVFPDDYDHALPLVIDPVLVFGTYSGSTATTYGFSATYDATGCLYAGGECFGIGWPVTTGAYQTTYGGGVDCGLNKYSSNGTMLIYSTYYGGSGSDVPNNLVVNINNELMVMGSTASGNLPVTTGCFQSTYGGGGEDLFVAHFNATGSALLGATYIGGSGQDGYNTYSLSANYGDQNRGEIFTDSGSNIYVAGSTSSANFPTTTGAYQTTLSGAQDGCVFKLNSTCTSMLWSTYLGGSSEDACFALLRNSLGNIVVVGGTKSTNFPTTTAAYQPAYGGSTDGFVSILSSTGGSLLKSTFLGTTGYDHAFKVQIDAADSVYVLGQTTGTFPISNGVYSNAGGKLFIARLKPDLSNVGLSTRISSSTSQMVPTAFLYDVCGNIYVCAFQAPAGLPLTSNAFQSTQGGFWLCVLSPNMTALSYATYMGTSGDHVDGGSSRFDPQGIVYHSVCTASNTFPTTSTAWKPTKQSTASWDVASFKFDFQFTGVHAGLSLGTYPDTGCAPYTVQFTNTSTGAITYLWNFGDGTTSTLATPPAHTYTNAGVYTVKIYAYNTGSCISTDSAQLNLVVVANQVHAVPAVTGTLLNCTTYSFQFQNNSTNAVSYSWDFGDGSTSTATAPSHTYAANGPYTVRLIAHNLGTCNKHDTAYLNVIEAVAPPITISVTAADPPCFGTTGTVVLATTGGNAPLTYAQDAGAFGTSNSFGSLTAGTYVFHVKDMYGCSHDTALTLSQPPPLYFRPDSVIQPTCEGFKDGAIALSGVGGTMPYSFAVNSAVFGPGHFFQQLPEGVYVIHLKDAHGCTNDTTITLTGFPPFSLAADVSNVSCNDLKDGRVALITSGGTTPFTYTIRSGGAGQSSTGIFDTLNNGTYIFRVQDAHGCIKDTTLSITQPDKIQISIANTGNPCEGAKENGTLVATVTGGSTPYTYSWNTSLAQGSPSLTGLPNGHYILALVDANGCIDSAAADITDACCMFIPSAFTPNSNGKNDRFYPRGDGLQIVKSFRIYDRWGEKIFERSNFTINDITQSWDGTFKGKQLPPDTYVYVVEAVCRTGEDKNWKGNVLLLK